MCTVRHNTIIPEPNDATEREGEWVGFPVRSQTAVVGSQFSEHLQQSGGETTPMQTMDVLSINSPRTQRKKELLFFNLSQLTLSGRAGERRWTRSPRAPCYPRGLFSISSRSLENPTVPKSLAAIWAHTKLITHTHTHVQISLKRLHNSHLCNLQNFYSVAAICVCLHRASHMWRSGLSCTLRNSFRKKCGEDSEYISFIPCTKRLALKTLGFVWITFFYKFCENSILRW